MTKTKHSLLLLFMLLTAAAAFAGEPFDVNLWQKKTPNSNGIKNDTARVRVFLPDAKHATGRAVVICPGGGYKFLSMDHEGYDWAPFFNDMGIAAVVLTYRLPHGNSKVPLSDAEEAIRLCRRNALKWHINKDDIGIMGFSAGGHLASTVATHSTGDAAPNFQILFYPVITMMPGFTHQGSHDNLLGKDAKKKAEKELSNDMQVTRSTPRACIMLSDDDNTVPPMNGVNYYAELYRHDIPASLYVYPGGGHGYGIKPSFKYHIEMLLDLKAWLRSF